jgi:hypothetical protein
MGVDSNGSGCDMSNLSGGGSIAAASTSPLIPTILQILLCSLGGTKQKSQSSVTQQQQQQGSKQITTINLAATTMVSSNFSNSGSSSQKPSYNKQKSSSTGKQLINEENLNATLVNLFFKTTGKDVLYKFIRTYLLEAANVNIRWTMHTLLYNVHKNSAFANQELLYEILTQLWSDAMTTYGMLSHI